MRTLIAMMLAATPAMGQVFPDLVTVRLADRTVYQLEPCLPPCACPGGTVRAPAIGSMTFIKFEETPLEARYAVVGVWMESAPATGPDRFEGFGEYRMVRTAIPEPYQQLTLDVVVDGIRRLAFDSGLVLASGGMPQPRLTTRTDQVVCSRYTIYVDTSRTCPGDLNADGATDFNDYLEFLNLYNAESPAADWNRDGAVDFNDYLVFLNVYNAEC